MLFSIQTLGSLRAHHKLTYLLQINPAAVYISLIRNTLLATQREAMPGSKPYSKLMCQQYYAHLNDKAYVFNSAYCHPVVSQTSLLLWGVGWAVGAVVIGFLFFWRGGEVRPWLNAPWWWWMTCTSSTGCTAQAATRARARLPCSG